MTSSQDTNCELAELRSYAAALPGGFCETNLLELSHQRANSAGTGATAAPPVNDLKASFAIPYNDGSPFARWLIFAFVLAVFLFLDWYFFAEECLTVLRRASWTADDWLWLTFVAAITIAGIYSVAAMCFHRTTYEFARGGVTITTGPLPWWRTEFFDRKHVVEVFDDITGPLVPVSAPDHTVEPHKHRKKLAAIDDYHQVWLRLEIDGQIHQRLLFEGVTDTDEWLLGLPDFCNSILGVKRF